MHTSIYKYTLFLVIQTLFLSLIFSCNHKQIPSNSTTITPTNQPAQILYLTLGALNDTITNTIQVKIIQQAVVRGTLKSNGILPAGTQSGNWMISLLTEKDNPISSVIISNPLINELEYADESGKFQRKTVKLTRAEISLRFNYSATIKKIKVEAMVSNNTLKTLHSSVLIF